MSDLGKHATLCQDTEVIPADEPIAIVGMALRLPGGVSSSEEFWELLVNKRDGHCPVPSSRYNAEAFFEPGKAPTSGYFLQEDPSYFDAPFFSITPQEAMRMDPQQRLLLEVVWECLENAGARKWQGQDIGCFVGLFGEDWLEMSFKSGQQTDRYHAVGTGEFALSNRVSYEFDLKGPSMTIQSACSASLVGLHQACQALRLGQCSAAIAAGTNIILSPTMTTTMVANRVLSLSGTCRTFDAQATGYGRGEAINAVYVKRLSDALRDHDPIRAVIRSTCTNFDGKTQRISHPSPTSQETLIRNAYRQAQIENLRDTGFFECHGTGTVVGDAVETSVVGKLFQGAGVTIGSVKPNVGHSEGASGLTSVIKAVLALEHRIIPPNVHFNTPSPRLGLAESKLQVPLEAIPWPEDRHERASVNCFGIGGSNAHVILDSAASFLSMDPPPLTSTDSELLFISAQSAESLNRRVGDLTRYLNHQPSTLHDLAYTLAVRREHLPHRAFAVAYPDVPVDPSNFHKLTYSSSTSNVAFVFTGQGAQWAGMGRALMHTHGCFTAVVDQMDEALQGLDDPPEWKLKEELAKDPILSRVQEVELSQALCTALQVGVVSVLAEWGIKFHSVVGHSSGEMAAAYAAGAITLQSAIILAYYRGKLAKTLEGLGTMASVGLSRPEVAPFLVDHVMVACENSPQNVTISGDSAQIDQVLAHIKSSNPETFCRKMAVRVPYHSEFMGRVAQAYQDAVARHIEHKTSMLPMFSSVTGETITKPGQLDATYWRRNLESPVLFSGAVQNLIQKTGHRQILIEIGPHSVLSAPIRQIVQSVTTTKHPPVYIPTLVRNDDDARSLLLSTAGHLVTMGLSVDLSAIIGPGRTLTNLPRYPWQHDTRYLKEGRPWQDWRLRPHRHHELLGSRTGESTALEPAWRNMLHLDNVPWLSEHVLQGQVTFPGAGYIAMAGEGIHQLHPDIMGYSLRNVHFKAPLLLSYDAIEVITRFNSIELADGVSSDWYGFSIAAYDGGSWNIHCQGQITPDHPEPLHCKVTCPFPRPVESKRWYQALHRRGLEYGPRFQGLQDITASPTGRIALGTVTDPLELHESRYAIHPCAIDQCLQLMGVAASSGIPNRLQMMYIPAMIERLYIAKGAPKMTVEVETWEGLRQGQCGNGIGMVDSRVVFSMQSGLLYALDSPAANGAPCLASRMDWKPDIDVLPSTGLLPEPHPNPDYEDTLKCGGFLCLMCIVVTAERIRHVQSEQPHLMKWKEWILTQAALITAGKHPSFVYLANWVERVTSEAPHIRRLKDELGTCEKKTTDSQEVLYPALPLWAQMHPNEMTEFVEKALKDPLATFGGHVFPCMLLIFSHCVEFMTGEQSALEYLMEDNSWKTLYESPAAETDWSHFLSLLCHSNPALRILEIGAGSGSATKRALPHLKSHTGVRMYSRYMFTDISSGFLEKAREMFDQEHMEYSTLDITRDPVEQGFEPHSFDLIIASNVLHATPSLNTTLQHVHTLLSANGRLLLQEIYPDMLYTDYIMGVLPGWWLGESDRRAEKPYVSPERWDQELRAAGFTGTDTTVYDVRPPCQSSATMISRPAVELVLPEKVTLVSHCPNEKWVADVEREFRSKGHTVQIARLDQVPQDEQNGVIILDDVKDSYFRDISHEAYLILRRFLCESKERRLLWVTQATQSVCQDPSAGMIHGLARALRHELHQDISVLEVDCVGADSAKTVYEVHAKIQKDRDTPHLDNEYEFALSGGVVHTCRAHWMALQAQRPSAVSPETPRKLRFSQFGRLDTLQWIPKAMKSELDCGQVEVDIAYVGLNFRDLMVSMGLVGNPDELGIEATGVVRRLGPGVTDFNVGDNVCMIGSGLLATRTVVPARNCVKYSEHISSQDMAAMWSVYITAIYALIHVGNVRQGQSVLVHSAAGGVGLASIHICQLLGAEVYATVGSEEKARHLVDNIGVPRDRIFCSRDESFLPSIMKVTNGRGVDVVLNSLAGKLLHASWECVAPYGKMIELGKRDFLTHGVLSMSPFLANRTFIGMDLFQISQDNSELHDSIKATLFQYFKEDKIRPIRPVKVFEAGEAENAFRHMQAGTHMGKIVIQMPTENNSLPCQTFPDALEFPNDASYLLVGGMGGIGRSVSTWMVENGARELVYLSRSAGESDSDQAFIRELEAQDCKVICVKGTVTDMADIRRALTQCTKRLAGVLQMALTLKDGAFKQMTYEEWMATLAPKVNGTWNLHHAVEGIILDFFVMFGSAVGTVGSLTQANYAAATSFLDAFVQYRRQHGLPASILNLGAVEDIGLLSQHQGYLQNAQTSCIPLLCEKDVLEGLSVAIQDSPSGSESGNLVVGLGYTKPMSETSVLPMWGQDVRFSLFSNLQSTVAVQAQAGDDELKSLLAEIEQCPSLLGKAETIVQFRRTMGKTCAENMMPGRELNEEQAANLVIDSLMAIQMKNWARRVTKVELSLPAISKANTVGGFSTLIVDHLRARHQQDEMITE